MFQIKSANQAFVNYNHSAIPFSNVNKKCEGLSVLINYDVFLDMTNFTLKSGELLSVREVSPEDAVRIIEYCNLVGGETDYLSFGANGFDKTIKEEMKILESYEASTNQLYILGELKGEIVGLLDVSASPKERIRHVGEFGISVRKAHWGKGIAGILIEYMFNWAKETEIIKKLNLHVISNNESAIKLYRKYDFAMEGRISKEFFVNGQYYDMIAMGHWLE